jgi:hypothetical protein
VSLMLETTGLRRLKGLEQSPLRYPRDTAMKRRITIRPEFGTRLLEMGVTPESLNRVTQLSMRTIHDYAQQKEDGRGIRRHTASVIARGVMRLTGCSPEEAFAMLFTEE